MSLRTGYRVDIDGLRALAIVSVVLGHFFPTFVPGGFIGVDIFFVISGFLITGVILKDLRQSRFSFGRFYAHRFRRIMPALTVVLLTVWATGWLVLFADEFQSLGKHVAAGATYVSNILLWRETGYFDRAAELKPLLHLWSIGIEEQFYLAWPALFVLWHRMHWSIGRLIGFLVLVSFLINVTFVQMHGTTVFYLLPFRFWELLVGGWLAYAETKKNSSDFILSADLKSFVAAALFFLSIAMISGAKPYPGWWALLPVLSTLLFISAGDRAWFNRRILSCRPVVFVGLISYPLYLWHWPILSFLRITENETGSSYPLKLGLLVSAFVLAWITYKCVDQPIKKSLFSDEWLDNNKRKFLAASFVIIFMVTLLGVLTSKGKIKAHESAATSQFVSAYANYAADKFSPSVRRGKCHLDTYDPSDFDPICYESNAPLTLALWGDSHSSHLYPGLRNYFGEDVSIMQFSRGCPPLSQIDNDGTPLSAICIRSNGLVMNALRDAKPDVLILAAHWGNYHPNDASFIEKLNSTVLEAKALGIKNVVVIGKVPTWKDRLYKVMALIYLDKRNSIPNKSIYGRIDDSDLQEKFSRNFENLSIPYLNISQQLCNHDGCTVMVGSNMFTDLISFDNGHLTENGSKYVVTNFVGPFINDVINHGQ